MKATFTLEKAAKKKGGDKYSATIKGETRDMSIYVPQSVSRPKGNPVKKLTVIIKVAE